ncbi:MAG: LuxR C-terminal-related transcriptional regulator [Gaiellales bacterium]
MPTCPVHAGSTVRRYRTHGPAGPGVYPQCVPAHDGQPHLLEWPVAEPTAEPADDSRDLSDCELAVLTDAAAGLTTLETAHKRTKGVETVKTQRRSILLKLGARNMTHAVGLTNETRHAAQAETEG